MVLRESNALFLEVLENPPAIGVPIEVDIFDGSSPATLLATLENAKDVALQQQLNETGSASFRINRHDPKATAEIVDRENLAKIKVGGVYRFSFWMRERKIVVLEEGEEAEEYWSIGGPGALAVLDRAEMWTESYIGDDPIGGVWDLGNAFGGDSVGQMFRRVIDESLAKTPSPIGSISTNWTYDVDSHGESWSDNADLEVNVGDNLLGVAKLLTGLGLDVRMRHDLLLEAFVELGRHFDVASGAVRPVVFRGGQNVTTSLSRRSQGGIATRALVKGAGDLTIEVSRLDLEADPHIGRREIFLSVPNAKDTTTMQRAGEAELEGRLLDTEAITFGVDHGLGAGQYEPWADYDIGDWVTLDEAGVYDLATYRVVGWTIKQAEDDYEIVLDCNSIEYEDLLKLARKGGLDGAGGSTGGSSTVGSGGGSGGGGTTGSTSKVAAEAGDSAGYLYDKLQAGAGIVQTLVGVAGSRKVEISLGAIADALDIDLTGIEDGDTLVWNESLGLFLPGAGGGSLPITTAGDLVYGAAAFGSDLVSNALGTATADNSFSGSFLPPKASDDNTGTDWARSGFAVGQWWQFDFATPQSLSRIRARGRNSPGEHFGAGTITFSDGGASVALPQVNANAFTTVDFAERTGITWFRLTATSGMAGNSGLAEVEAYLAGPGAGEPIRLPIGPEGSTLKVVGGIPTWVP